MATFDLNSLFGSSGTDPYSLATPPDSTPFTQEYSYNLPSEIVDPEASSMAQAIAQPGQLTTKSLSLYNSPFKFDYYNGNKDGFRDWTLGNSSLGVNWNGTPYRSPISRDAHGFAQLLGQQMVGGLPENGLRLDSGYFGPELRKQLGLPDSFGGVWGIDPTKKDWGINNWKVASDEGGQSGWLKSDGGLLTTGLLSVASMGLAGYLAAANQAAAGASGAGGAAGMNGGTGLTLGSQGATGLTMGSGGVTGLTAPAGWNVANLGIGATGGALSLNNILSNLQQNAMKQAGSSIVTGRPADWKSLALSAASPYIGAGTGQILGNIPTTDSEFFNAIMQGGGRGALNAAVNTALSQGDIGKAMALSGAMGGLGGGLSNLTERFADYLTKNPQGIDALDAVSSGVGGFTNVPTQTSGGNMGDYEDLMGNGMNWGGGEGLQLGNTTGSTGLANDSFQGFGSEGLRGQFPQFDNMPNIPGQEFNWGVPQGGGLLNGILKSLGKPQVMTNILSGLYGMHQQGKQMDMLRGMMDSASKTVDPFASQRQQYQDRLAESYNNPEALLARPEYQGLARMFQKQIEARDAKAGRNSQYGARALEMQDNAMKYLDQYRRSLHAPSGANVQPNYGVLNGLNAALAQAQSNKANVIPGMLASVFNGLPEGTLSKALNDFLVV